MQKLIIREALKRQGITQTELANRLAIKQSALSRTLSARTVKGLSVNTLLQIADIYCCDVRDFFSDKDPFTPRRDIKPIIQRAGGKTRELHLLAPHFPENIENFYDIFCGGGSVFLNATAKYYYINDISTPLINLYKQVKDGNAVFLSLLADFERQWQTFDEGVLSDMTKLYNTIPIDLQYDFEILDSLIDKARFPLADETAAKSVLFVYYRHLFNHATSLNIPAPVRAFLFFIMSQYGFSGMQRVNERGEFSVPYAGLTYNKKSVRTYLKCYQSEVLYDILAKVTIGNKDFIEFINANPPQPSDFIFADPPYTSSFSSYDQTPFTMEDHRRLADYLINNCPCKWMVVVNDSDFIRGLYTRIGIFFRYYQKKYSVNIRNRNNQIVKHIIITNY